MNVVEQIIKLSRELPQEKQVEVLDFIDFLVSRQATKDWTVEKRQQVIARTMDRLARTHTSSEAFAESKREEKAKEERRWRA
jgi:hypothetical protein